MQNPRELRRSLTFALFLGFVASLPVDAATRVWTGANGSAWSDAANWGGVAPQAGDDLVFPAGVQNLACNHDLGASTVFQSLSFTGGPYVVGGDSLQPGSGGISVVGGQVTFVGPVVFSGSAVVSADGPVAFQGPIGGVGVQVNLVGSGPFSFSNGTSSWSGLLVLDGSGGPGVVDLGGSGAIPAGVRVEVQANDLLALHGFADTIANLQGAGNVSLGGATLTVAQDGMTSGHFSGVVSGAGSLVVGAGNTLRLTGVHNSTGTLRAVGPSSLLLEGTTWPGPVTLDDDSVAGFSNDSAVGPLTLAGTSQLTPGGGGTVCRGSSGDLSFSEGTTYRVLVNGISAGSFSQVAVTGSVALGGANLVIVPTPPIPQGTQLVVIDNDGSDPVAGIFSGLPEGGATLDGVWSISYVGGTGNDVVLTALLPTTPVELSSFTAE